MPSMTMTIRCSAPFVRCNSTSFGFVLPTGLGLSKNGEFAHRREMSQARQIIFVRLGVGVDR